MELADPAAAQGAAKPHPFSPEGSAGAGEFHRPMVLVDHVAAFDAVEIEVAALRVEEEGGASMPGPDHHFSPREPSTRWPSRASSSTSRTAQFSTRSLVMTRQLAENRPHLGPSASRCAPKVYFSVPLVPYLRRKRTSEREDPTAQT